eukprot:CAMPEP_0113447938 /NCGR_PEP_ID=MMETSP0014_2-20120614/4501_1 /TAXON_ID=2857 /ORGANISM="Nitzschia sp." /LENGTH=463 /DNA_ID=CAMNT_0000339119 /DNA_START=85 /DNA_END=1476 /DNA_ORIENTATION=- /assembly_acc=CAM_ASM_000159
MTSLNDYIKHKFSQSESSQGYGSNDGNRSDDNNIIIDNNNNNNANKRNTSLVTTSTTSSSIPSTAQSDSYSETGVLLVSTPLGGGEGATTPPPSSNTVAFADCNNDDNFSGSGDGSGHSSTIIGGTKNYTLRRLAMDLSLYCNLFITLTKLVAYLRTFSLSVLAALLDSVLDVVSQLVLNYTEKHSSMQRSSALYPAGASRLEPIGVLTCAALMGMASFEVLKESGETLIFKDNTLEDLTLRDEIFSVASMITIVVVKLLLLVLCEKASNKRSYGSSKSIQFADPTLEALAQDHWNDALSNAISAVALFLAVFKESLWWVDPVGAIIISLYIIYSWYQTGKEQIEQLTGKSAPEELIEELVELADHFDEKMMVDTVRAYHFGPKFLVEVEVVMPHHTPLKESHDLGMELQYEIEAREEVERCFVHIDYESRDYDEHVVSKVPEIREHLLRQRTQRKYKSAMSV